MFIGLGLKLAGLFGKHFISDRTAKIIGIGAAVLAALVVVGLFFAIHDRKVIAAHDAKQENVNLKADRKADTKAAETRHVDDVRLTTEEAQLKGVRDNAPPTQSATDRRRARHACLRMQQAARAEHRESPACQ